MTIEQKELLEKILETIDFYRGIILDSVEQECGDNPNWKYLRSRLLKAFGDRGLHKKIMEIFGQASVKTKFEMTKNYMEGL